MQIFTSKNYIFKINKGGAMYNFLNIYLYYKPCTTTTKKPLIVKKRKCEQKKFKKP